MFTINVSDKRSKIESIEPINTIRSALALTHIESSLIQFESSFAPEFENELNFASIKNYFRKGRKNNKYFHARSFRIVFRSKEKKKETRSLGRSIVPPISPRRKDTFLVVNPCTSKQSEIYVRKRENRMMIYHGNCHLCHRWKERVA